MTSIWTTLSLHYGGQTHMEDMGILFFLYHPWNDETRITYIRVKNFLLPLRDAIAHIISLVRKSTFVPVPKDPTVLDLEPAPLIWQRWGRIINAGCENWHWWLSPIKKKSTELTLLETKSHNYKIIHIPESVHASGQKKNIWITNPKGKKNWTSSQIQHAELLVLLLIVDRISSDNWEKRGEHGEVPRASRWGGGRGAHPFSKERAAICRHRCRGENGGDKSPIPHDGTMLEGTFHGSVVVIVATPTHGHHGGAS